MAFEVGDRVVVPNYGVGKIRTVERMNIEDRLYEVFVIDILANGMEYRAPVDQAGANGLREIIPMSAVEKVYEVLRDRDTPADKQTWNRRYREYTNKIKTGDPLEVAAVLRDLARLKAEKTLSFGEKKMYDQAHSLIVQEIAAAKGIDEGLVKSELETLFAAP
jgi:CarD family transcriptional regulator